MLADIVKAGLASWWAPGLAFAAGVVSFASPCVFPLVPGYLSFVAGDRAEGERGLVPILLFIGGFSAVFVALFGFTDVFFQALRGTWGRVITGGIVGAFGVILVLYALKKGPMVLYAERRPFLGRVRSGRVWAFPLGMAFAAGWTPCIGPVLAGVLAIAAGQGSSVRGAFLLLMYSAGLGLPFLLVGLGIKRLMGAFDFIQRNYRKFAGASGVLMLTIGILMVTNLWVQVLGPVLRLVGRFTPAI
jgi:cytochrome c-type biogenesis protein